MSRDHGPSIWWWAFGYFATYVPYIALIAAITDIGIHGQHVDGVEVLPVTFCATVVAAIAFLYFTGWWRHAVKPGRRFPTPTGATVASGLCSSGIIITTSYGYTFHGVLLPNLLMKGGVLILAPIIDAITGRKIRWYSATALVLAIAALSLPLFWNGLGNAVPFACGVDVGIYLACYFVRLQLMTRRAKSNDPGANLRYFAEEQLVAAPALLAGAFLFALVGPGFFAEGLHAGFFDFWSAPIWFVGLALLVGVMSQGTGIFGGLILLDRSENTFSVPVNRASSVFAALVGSTVLWILTGQREPQTTEIIGALVMIAAIVVLSVGSLRDKKKRAA